MTTEEHFALSVKKLENGRYVVRVNHVSYESQWLGDAAENAVCDAYMQRVAVPDVNVSEPK